jgi:hypothetical protein
MLAVERAAAKFGPARLEYRLAFDLAAAALARAGDGDRPIILVASAPIFVRESLARASGRVAVLADSAAVAEAARRLANSVTFLGRSAVELLGAEIDGAQATGRFGGCLWASPRPETWLRRLRALDAGLADRAPLAILIPGNGARLSAFSRTAWMPGEPVWTDALRRQLTRLGYRTGRAYSFGGPASLVWAAISRLASVARRPDLADRCEAAYRSALAGPGHHPLARSTLLIAHKATRR